jgi:uncharacterized membrane protein (UPF0127 family)
MIGLISACSGRQTKSSTKSTNDRSSSLSFTDSVSFVSAGDTLTTIGVAVADEANERNEGLMDVNSLPENNGMLFIFEEQREELSFWMANTPLSLDIIFVNEDKQIVRIHHSTPPFTEKSFSSGKPAIYAVETNGGFCVAHDIQEGISVTFSNSDW